MSRRLLALVVSAFLPILASAKETTVSIAGGKLWVPVRFGLYGGYHSSQNSFDADKKNFDFSGTAAGLDFSVPVPPIRFSFGATGWMVFANDTAKEWNGFYLVAPFIGYSHKTFELFLGPAFATMQNRQKQDLVAPNIEEENIANMSCGFMGIRQYMSTGLSMGIAFNGYYCEGESYNKETTDASMVKSTSQISSGTHSYGGNVSLIFTWGEKRQVK